MKKFPRRTFARTCLGMMIPLGSACGKKGEGQSELGASINIAALYDSRRDPFRNSQSYLFQRLLQTRAGTELLVWDAGGNANLQSDQLAAALAARPDFLIVFPVNPAALAAAINRSGATGPRIFVFAEIPVTNPRVSLVLCPDSEIGRVAGEFVVQSLRAKAAEEGKSEPSGRIVELTVAPPDAPHAEYSDGFSKAIVGQPNIKLVHQAPCKLLGEDTADRMGEALRLQKEFEVIFAHNDLIAAAASKAVAATRPELTERMLVLGVDGNLGKGGGKEMIIKGEIDATICRPPLVDLAWAIIEKSMAEPQFNPKPRYDVKPIALNFESALEVAKTGLPSPSID